TASVFSVSTTWRTSASSMLKPTERISDSGSATNTSLVVTSAAHTSSGSAPSASAHTTSRSERMPKPLASRTSNAPASSSLRMTATSRRLASGGAYRVLNRRSVPTASCAYGIVSTLIGLVVRRLDIEYVRLLEPYGAFWRR